MLGLAEAEDAVGGGADGWLPSAFGGSGHLGGYGGVALASGSFCL